jgi:hypothetical protein
MYHIIGPMSGFPRYNHPKFADTIIKLQTHLGHDMQVITTPFTACDIVWTRVFGRLFDPQLDKCDYGDGLMEEIFVENMNLIAKAKHIVVIPHWPLSKGTIIEVHVAKHLHKFLLRGDNFKPLEVGTTLYAVRHTLFGEPDGKHTKEVPEGTGSEGSKLVSDRERALARGNEA